ncbi:MAG: GNAT family N-acetyltransferase, partial [Kiritimatiellia bacterium]
MVLDGYCTSPEWQRHPSRICVWGIGAFEQHSVHLPLLTDTLSADYWAHYVAEQLDAALFPTLPFGTSLEMTGFRGTLTLRPETLMQIVRDVADEAEKQGFTRMIIINGHGGNHALVPVVRDINRVDRPLKIILVQPGQCCDSALVGTSVGPNFHCSENETATFMARWPELVREEREDLPPPPADWEGLQQADLTTFGIGHFNPTGAAGRPSLATLEKGKAIIASIKERIIPFIRERLARLDRMPRYSGAGGIAVRAMVSDDVPEVVGLAAGTGSNILAEEWQTLLGLALPNSLVAVHNGRVIGAIVVLRYDVRWRWISFFAVESAFRGIGVGQRLLSERSRAVAPLECLGVVSDLGLAGWWEKHGFCVAEQIEELACACVAVLPGACKAGAEDINDNVVPELLRADAEAFGAERATLLQMLLARQGGLGVFTEKNGKLSGFCLGRPGGSIFRVGPLVAQTYQEAQDLLLALLRKVRGLPYP